MNVSLEVSPYLKLELPSHGDGPRRVEISQKLIRAPDQMVTNIQHKTSTEEHQPEPDTSHSLFGVQGDVFMPPSRHGAQFVSSGLGHGGDLAFPLTAPRKDSS